MQIRELYKYGQVVSLEVFPPKQDADVDEILSALGDMCALAPDFISVTYGAGGAGNVNRTAEIAAHIEGRYTTTAMAHLTCAASAERIHQMLDEMHRDGIRNVLALRGDIPEGEHIAGGYRYASELVSAIRSRGDFCIGAACYPEGHIDCDSPALDLLLMRRKQDAGADFFLSQLCFDDELILRFIDRARGAGVTLPISVGVMPILGRKQIERMIFLCGASLPSAIIKLLHMHAHAPADLRAAGIEYAARQLQGLLSRGVDGVHIYTMNKADIAATCFKRLGRA